MQCKAALIKLKPGSLPRVREWAKTINERRKEALATLRDEGIHIESWFLLSRDDGDYLISYLRSKDFDRAESAFKHSLHEIDAYHQQFKDDTWEQDGREVTELLVDLSLEDKT